MCLVSNTLEPTPPQYQINEVFEIPPLSAGIFITYATNGFASFFLCLVYFSVLEYSLKHPMLP